MASSASRKMKEEEEGVCQGKRESPKMNWSKKTVKYLFLTVLTFVSLQIQITFVFC